MSVFGCNREVTFTESFLSVKRYALDGHVFGILGFVRGLVLFYENLKYLHSFKLPLSYIVLAMRWS